MKLLKAALAAAVALTVTTAVVTTADARPHYRMVKTCKVVFRRGHRDRVCRTVRRAY